MTDWLSNKVTYWDFLGFGGQVKNVMRMNSLKTAKDPAACSVRKGGLFSVTFYKKNHFCKISMFKMTMLYLFKCLQFTNSPFPKWLGLWYIFCYFLKFIIFKIVLGWCFSFPLPVFPTQLNMPICGKGYLSCCWFNLMSYNNFPEKWPNYSNTFIKRVEQMFLSAFISYHLSDDY